jgi:hypothetical protein
MKNSDARQVVLLIHGIRTQGEWEERIARILEEEADVTRALPIRYGFVNALQFWCPLTRGGAIRRVHREFRTALDVYPNHAISVLAHSFGTYAVGRILEEYSDIKIHRLALCGAVLPREFRWDRVQGQVDQVVNDCGSRDIWPVMAVSASWGYGASGAYGFGTVLVQDRFHDFRHSDFFTDAFAREFWVPLFRDGTVQPSAHVARPPTPYWRSLLEVVRLRYIAPVVLALATIALFGGSYPRLGRYDCEADGRPLPGCEIVTDPEGIQMRFVSAGHGTAGLVNTFSGRVHATGHGCVEILLTDRFDPGDGRPTKGPAGKVSACRVGGSRWQGTWSDGEFRSIPFTFVGR